MKKLRFNVFGREHTVIREQELWLLYQESVTAIRRRIYDIVIPDFLSEDELTGYLDDIYHEYASDDHPSVIRLD